MKQRQVARAAQRGLGWLVFASGSLVAAALLIQGLTR
jgi:hypothetical protein